MYFIKAKRKRYTKQGCRRLGHTSGLRPGRALLQLKVRRRIPAYATTSRYGFHSTTPFERKFKLYSKLYWQRG